MAYDFDLSETKNRLRRNYRQQHNLDKQKAVWGDAFGVVADPNRPGKVYVRVMTSNGLSVARSVWAPRTLFGVQVGDPIKLKYEDGRLMVDGPDHAAMLSTGTDPVARQQQYDSPSTPQGDFETLNLIAQGGYLVSLKGWNIITNGLYYEVSFPDIDLESYLPSSGEMCYAGIFALDDFSGVEIVTSTPVSIWDEPLGPSDVQECLDGALTTSTPAWAVALTGDMTAITQADIKSDGKDLRQLVNAGAGTVATVDYPKRFTMWHDEALVTVGNALQSDYVAIRYGSQSYQNTPANGNTFTQSFMLRAGTYTFSVLGGTANNEAKVDWYIDNVLAISAQDWYSVGTVSNVVKAVGSIVVSGDGFHTLKGVVNGKNGSSSDYYLPLTKYWFTPSSD